MKIEGEQAFLPPQGDLLVTTRCQPLPINLVGVATRLLHDASQSLHGAPTVK